jgi:hypothetical protein
VKSGGIFLPQKISVWAQLVHCDWLTEMSRVESNSNVGGYKIAEFVNTYQVRVHNK